MVATLSGAVLFMQSEVKDNWKLFVVMVVWGSLVALNLLQNTAIVVFLSAIVGYMLLPVLQPTKDIFTKPAKKANRVSRTKKSQSGQRRKTEEEEPSDESEEDSEDDMASEHVETYKSSTRKLQRKALRQKLFLKKLPSKKVSVAREQEPPAALVVEAAPESSEAPPVDDLAQVMQYAEQVISNPVDDVADAVNTKVVHSLDDAMQGVTKYIELEKRSRAIDQQQWAGGNAIRSPHAQAAKVHVQQAMVDLLKCINEVHRLQATPQPFEYPAAPNLMSSTPFMPKAPTGFEMPGTPLIPGAPPGLEPEAYASSPSIGPKRTTLSASAKPFAPLFGCA